MLSEMKERKQMKVNIYFFLKFFLINILKIADLREIISLSINQDQRDLLADRDHYVAFKGKYWRKGRNSSSCSNSSSTNLNSNDENSDSKVDHICNEKELPLEGGSLLSLLKLKSSKGSVYSHHHSDFQTHHHIHTAQQS